MDNIETELIISVDDILDVEIRPLFYILNDGVYDYGFHMNIADIPAVALTMMEIQLQLQENES